MPEAVAYGILMTCRRCPAAKTDGEGTPPRPVKPQLISFVCHQTNDMASADEAKLQINGVDVVGPVDIKSNEFRDLRGVPPPSSAQRARSP